MLLHALSLFFTLNINNIKQDMENKRYLKTCLAYIFNRQADDATSETCLQRH